MYAVPLADLFYSFCLESYFNQFGTLSLACSGSHCRFTVYCPFHIPLVKDKANILIGNVCSLVF